MRQGGGAVHWLSNRPVEPRTELALLLALPPIGAELVCVVTVKRARLSAFGVTGSRDDIFSDSLHLCTQRPANPVRVAACAVHAK